MARLRSELVSVSVPVAVDGPAPIVFGPPLRGGPWICANGLRSQERSQLYRRLANWPGCASPNAMAAIS